MWKEWIVNNLKRLRTSKWECGLLILLLILTGGVLIWNDTIAGQYEHYYNEDISYVKGVVTAVDNGQLTVDQNDPDRYLGMQKVSANILSGKHRGEVVEIENYLTASNNVFVKEGTKVIISQDEPEGTAPYYLIYNYNRSYSIFGIAAAFLVLMILVGGAKGIRAVIGLLFTLFIIVMWMIPMIYLGYSPVLAAIITVVITSAAALLLLNGFTDKTITAILGTALGVIIVGIVFAVCSKLLGISGYNTKETDFMVLISNHSGLRISEVLFAGVLIASLGAVMDVGMSIASAVYEIHEANQSLSVKQLFVSGLNVGKDMIGTMSNTLILAFTGSGLSTLLVLTAYGIKYHQFVSSDFLAVEVGQGLSGTMAVILTVPLTSIISAAVYKRGGKQVKK